MNNEITVLVNTNRENIILELTKRGFKKIDDYVIDDIYLIKDTIDINSTNTLEILSNCLLVRNISNKKFKITYKNKIYDENENIISQDNISCHINSINEGINLLNAIGYRKLIKINDHILVYKKDDFEIALEYVNDKYLFLEIEFNDKYDTVEKNILELNKLNLDIDTSTYFAKKAKIIFEDEYR